MKNEKVKTKAMALAICMMTLMAVTGELTDGTPFEGSDTIRVLDKGKGK